ncbi:MAG: hypothetical protein NZ954_03945 [Thermofilaceae archaeon]|nr:hypothetical protein [Thermofilaceae archaeon]MCX8180833.1 hypothetical protein [Thermofilaceae archaeon]MDW8004619.1 hypothetical protein [Thermofilaceae archaeon]
MSIERARKLKELIEAFDGYRVGRYTSLTKVERILAELDLKLPYDWQDLVKDIKVILELPKTSEAYARLEKMERFASRLVKFNLLFLASALLLYTLSFWLANPSLGIVAFAMAIASVLMVNVVYVIRVYVNLRIDSLYAEKLPELEKLGARFKVTVDYLLKQLKRELKIGKFRLESFKLKLWLPDYAGIIIVKKPGRWSSRYEVRLT